MSSCGDLLKHPTLVPLSAASSSAIDATSIRQLSDLLSIFRGIKILLVRAET